MRDTKENAAKVLANIRKCEAYLDSIWDQYDLLDHGIDSLAVEFDGYEINGKRYTRILFLYPGKVNYYDSVWMCDSHDIKTGFYDQINVLRHWDEIKKNLQDEIDKAIHSAMDDDRILNHFVI